MPSCHLHGLAHHVLHGQRHGCRHGLIQTRREVVGHEVHRTGVVGVETEPECIVWYQHPLDDSLVRKFLVFLGRKLKPLLLQVSTKKIVEFLAEKRLV